MTEKRNRNGTSRRRGGEDAEISEVQDEAPSAEPVTWPEKVAPRRGLRGGTTLLLLLLAVAAATLGYRYWGFWQTSQPARSAPPPPTVTVAKPLVKELVEWKDFTGQFQAVESVDVRARVSGYLESINFTDGQVIKKGDLLFVIEPKPYELALETAKAQQAQAEAQLDLAKAQLERTAQLKQKDYATQETYDERLSQVNIATASRDAAIAAVDQAKLNLDYTRVTAPIPGRASLHELSVGNLVIGGTTGTSALLTTLVSLDPIHLFFNVSEADGMTYKRLVQKGEIPSARDNKVEVEGELIDESNWPLKGTIDFVDNQYDRSTGTIRVRAAFPNPNYFITPGQFGRVRVPMSQLHPALLVPDAAVVTDQSTKMLFTVLPDGTVAPKPVELGPVVDGNLRIIHSGIDANDQVIVNGLLRARPGQKVTPEQGTVEGAAAPKQ
ncbi:MAG: efflux RND transporter periplasmic adaptor subunit [Methyloceanibacter sp.]